MKEFDEGVGEFRRSQRSDAWRPFDPSSGFCALCWRRVEELTTNERLYSKNRRGKIREVLRPTLTPETLAEARARLQEIISARKKTNAPFLFGQKMHAFTFLSGLEIDYRALNEFGIESETAAEMLLDIIEQSIINEKWLADADIVGKKRLNRIALPGETAIANGSVKPPQTPSHILCAEHNPRRSIESRRRYQNDRRKMNEFELTIRELTTYYINQGHGIISDEDRTFVRQEAYRIVHMSTLEKIRELQSRGLTNQAEIGRIIGLSRKAISMALSREKNRVNLAPEIQDELTGNRLRESYAKSKRQI